MSPVGLLLVVLAEQAQGLQWTGAGVLEVLTALQRQITNQKLSFSQNPCRRKRWIVLIRLPYGRLVLTSGLPQYQMALMTLWFARAAVSWSLLPVRILTKLAGRSHAWSTWRERELLYDGNINFQVMGHCPLWQLWKEKQTGWVLKVNSKLKRKKNTK